MLYVWNEQPCSSGATWNCFLERSVPCKIVSSELSSILINIFPQIPTYILEFQHISQGRLAYIVVTVKIAQSCLILCDPMDYNLSGFSVQWILQARKMEWVAIPFSRESSQPKVPWFSGFVKFRLKLKKVGKTIQIWPKSNPLQWKWEIDSRDYLIDKVPEELWTEVPDIVQEAVAKNIA